ncbi:mechanosensitive ion channel family protein [Roseofilum reptotaenium CS-1145]|uniref:Mechanosensitive ion channel protein MscS n=1 Tax=Roseofilum reptotaenium AO1-A TaxID=1925591 RepID=A0A1L9QT20_9CYAN|nr:mechanosensitive ion channel family protein [Roseofilum reptotaenium]MDB9518168.1 mechanosensitive ion channel family protein [Roseofilum reptotaenium CS-1145]OJJ25766.1 mechanosensitive ion channel protein MscS [Roseofilum reptotaenium AO1-A]
MSVLFQEIKQSILNLVGAGIEALPRILVAIAFLMFTSWAAKFARKLSTRVTDMTIKNQSLRSLLIQLSSVAAWVVGILISSVIAFPDLRLGDVVGLLGLSSVAIGFAFQDIFKNFLAGILLLLQEPFRLGDQIIVDGYEGTVEEISIRSTQIRTYQGELIVVPNSIVFTSTVQVLTNLPRRRTDLAIGVDYNTPLSHAIEVLYNAISGVDGVLTEPDPEVDIVGFGDSSIDLKVRYWTIPNQREVCRIQTRVMLALKNACDGAEINIPYPIRTVYHYNQEYFNDTYPQVSSRTALQSSPYDQNRG